MKTNRDTPMKRHNFSISRRRFLAATVLATAGYFLPRRLFAEEESPVSVIRTAAATARITVPKLRGNVSMLEGSGGNIAVLTGHDGKLLVDAGIPATRVRITEALAGL